MELTRDTRSVQETRVGMRTPFAASFAATAFLLLGSSPASAQHMTHAHAHDSMAPMRHGAMITTLGLPMSRTGSGTSWLPDAAPMHAAHYLTFPPIQAMT